MVGSNSPYISETTPMHIIRRAYFAESTLANEFPGTVRYESLQMPSKTNKCLGDERKPYLPRLLR